MAAVQVVTLMAHGDAIKRFKKIEQTTLEDKAPAGESERLMCWIAASKLWRKAPVLGVGPRMFDYRWDEVRTPQMQSLPGRAHNLALEILCEYGLAGAAFFAIPLVIAVLRFCRRQYDSEDWTQPAALMGLAVVTLYEMFDCSFFTPTCGAISVVLLTSAIAGQTAKGRISPRWFTLMCIALASGFITMYDCQSYVNHQLTVAALKSKDPDQQSAVLKKAIHWQPDNADTHVYLANLLAALEMRKPREGQDFGPACEEFSRAIECNSYSLTARYGLAACLLTTDHKRADQEIDALNRLAPNSCKAAGLTVLYYRITGSTNEARPWVERMNQLLKYKVEDAVEGANCTR
jgi:hypothetical protein